MKYISVCVARSVCVLICMLTTHMARGTPAAMPDNFKRISDLEFIVETLTKKFILMESNYATLENSVMEHFKTQAMSNEFRINQQLQFNVLSKLIKGQKSWLADMDGLVKEPTGANKQTPDTNAPGPRVAFTAYMDTDMGTTSDGEVIIFNKVLTNEGAAYNKHTGVFTCPKSGLYDFSFVIGQRDKKGIWARLLVNDDAMVAAAADTEHNAQDLQGGNRVLVRLSEDDKVKVVSQGGSHIEGDSNRFTTFSGLFVAP